MAPKTLIERAQRWERTLQEAENPFRETVLYRELRPFVSFVLDCQKKLSWGTRLYVLWHGQLPER